MYLGYWRKLHANYLRRGKKTKMYLGILRVFFKNEVLKLKSSPLSPNPIGKDLLPLISQVLKSEADEIKSSLGSLLSNNEVIGIGGVHYYAVSKSVGKKTYSSKDLKP